MQQYKYELPWCKGCFKKAVVLYKCRECFLHYCERCAGTKITRYLCQMCLEEKHGKER